MPLEYEKERDALIRKGKSVQEAKKEAAINWWKRHPEVKSCPAHKEAAISYLNKRQVAKQEDEVAKEELSKIKKGEQQSEHKQPPPLASISSKDQNIQKKSFITVKRCLIGGIVACIVCYIGREVDASRSWFITVPITGLPWLIFKISDNEETGERVDVAEAIGVIIMGALLSLFSALPVLIGFAFLRNVFASH